MKQLTVPFLVVLLLSGALMVPSIPVAAAEPSSDVIVGYGLYEEPDWPAFWQKLNKYAKWNLEWYDGAEWVSVKSDLQIVRDYPEPNRAKLTLIFDASHAGNYRLTFAIDQIVEDYVTKLDQYKYELTYNNCSIVFDWSDAIEIPGLVFTHGVKDGYFWFRMRRDNVPLGAHVEIDPSIVAEYDFTNVDSWLANNDHHPSDSAYQSAQAMSFQVPAGSNRVLHSVEFRLSKVGSPTGNAVAQLFAHSGVFGTSSVPTGAALATSEVFDVSTLSGATTVRFYFTGANQVTMTAGAYYCIAYVNPATGTINTSNYVLVGTDNSAPAAPGNMARYINGAWGAYTTRDTCFAVYGTSAPAVLAVSATSTFSTGSYGWVNVTVQEDKGIANLNRVDLLANTTGAAENFTLRWTQATDTFSEVSDPSGIVEMLGSVREDVNATATKLAFRFRFYGATEGDLDVRIYVLNDDALDDTEDYPALFNFVDWEWDPIGDIINSAFALFGIMNYMTQALDFVNDISAHFTNSLVQLAVMINLQFQVIWQVWDWATDWFTRMITAVLDFGAALQMILNGTHPLIAGGVDLWNYFDFASAGQSVYDIAPLFFILYWIDSMGKRARTQGTLTVLYGDLQAFASVFAFFMGAFGMVIGYIEGKISWLFQALT